MDRPERPAKPRRESERRPCASTRQWRRIWAGRARPIEACISQFINMRTFRRRIRARVSGKGDNFRGHIAIGTRTNKPCVGGRPAGDGHAPGRAGWARQPIAEFARQLERRHPRTFQASGRIGHRVYPHQRAGLFRVESFFIADIWAQVPSLTTPPLYENLARTIAVGGGAA
jgi:hypothetical protein